MYIEGLRVITSEILYVFSQDRFLYKQTVQIRLKCRLVRHLIWVFTVCQGTHLGLSIPQSVN